MTKPRVRGAEASATTVTVLAARVLSHPPGQLRTHRVELPTKLDKQTTVERFAEPGGVTAEEDEC